MPRSGHLLELGRFLSARRAELTPAEVGLPDVGRRRTPGLRREEVATLAGVGASWYTWIEQGRAENVSPEILRALARALRLDEVELRYMTGLASVPTGGEVGDSEGPDLSLMPQIVENWLPQPAYVLDRYWNVLVANAVAHPLLGTPEGEGTNYLETLLTDTAARQMRPDWERDVESAVARFRADTWSLSADPGFVALIDRLRTVSTHFARLWDQYQVADDSCYQESLYHRDVGDMRFTRVVMDFTCGYGLKLVLLTPVVGSGTREAVERWYELLSVENVLPAVSA
ncbi:Helix-turn-helix domain-containing protein [Actinopolyspora xinjiangensis]|uniref:Helix-turn-helix domain-containing protein n=1 Tax=Actinopolyspora xinjiangensis TaxID=405564 RepID=A0A1H0VM16_9ACTN|nr:helix-turn-helix transcriptional regulator [Actinopolyspora xinjiangensis]SDP79403.1 Helix-turn-helix domain-containing protein [Actinopolyspora xinjiangensis]